MSEDKVKIICITIGLIAWMGFSYLSDKAKYEHHHPAGTATVHAD